MWKVDLQGLLAHKLRLALTALAIVLGVTFISGTFVLTDTLHNTFTTLFGHVYQNVDFEVRGDGAVLRQQRRTGAVRKPIPESIATTVRRVPGVGLRRGHGQRLRPVRLARREGDQQRWRAHDRAVLRPEPAAVGAPAGRGHGARPRRTTS